MPLELDFLALLKEQRDRFCANYEVKKTKLTDAELEAICHTVLAKDGLADSYFKVFGKESEAMATRIAETLVRREIQKKATIPPSLQHAFEAIPGATKASITAAVDKLTQRYIGERAHAVENKNCGGNLVYHNGGHAAEMSHDAELMLRRVAVTVFGQDQAAIDLYLSLAKAAHAAHDIVQSKTPPQNEYQSYLEFMRDVSKVLTQHLDEQHVLNMYRAVENMAYEIIVPGTVLNFATSKSLSEGLDEARGVEAPQDVLVAAAQKSASLHDTQRMTQVFRLLEDETARARLLVQYNACSEPLGRAGFALKPNQLRYLEEGTFPDDVKTTEAREEFLGTIAATVSFMQLAGQNMRMGVLELSKKFNRGGAMIDKLIAAVHDGEPPQWKDDNNPDGIDAKKCFNYICDKFLHGDLSELAFARKFNWLNTQATNARFRERYNLPDEFELYDTRNQHAWTNYAQSMQYYINECQAAIEHAPVRQKDALMREFISDFCILARNQYGHPMQQEQQQALENARQAADMPVAVPAVRQGSQAGGLKRGREVRADDPAELPSQRTKPAEETAEETAGIGARLNKLP